MAKRKNGYYAVVLNEESANRLRALAVHEIVHCHHLTLVSKLRVGDNDDVYWSHRLGEVLELRVVGIAMDDKGQAVYIPEAPSAKKFPHVTVSCAEGVPPVYSNELLERAMTGSAIEPLDMKLLGTICLVRHGGGKSGSK